MQELLKDLESICKKHKVSIVDTSGVFFTEGGDKVFKELIITKNIIDYTGGKDEK